MSFHKNNEIDYWRELYEFLHAEVEDLLHTRYGYNELRHDLRGDTVDETESNTVSAIEDVLRYVESTSIEKRYETMHEAFVEKLKDSKNPVDGDDFVKILEFIENYETNLTNETAIDYEYLRIYEDILSEG